MTYDDLIPRAIPNVYDWDRGQILLHLFRYEMCREALQKHAKADWRTAIKALEADERGELAKLTSTPQRVTTKASRERLTALHRAVTPYAIEARRTFQRTVYHAETDRLTQRLDGYRLALNAALGLPADFIEDEKEVTVFA